MKTLLAVVIFLLLILYLKSKRPKKKINVARMTKPPKKNMTLRKNKTLRKKIVQEEITVNEENIENYSKRFKGAWKPVGNLKPECPYCGYKFDKMPRAKCKCPSCKETIYPRVIPQSKNKSLLRLEDIPVLDKQKSAITYIQINTDKKDPEYQRAHKDLKKKFGFEPGENDVLWRIFNERSLQTSTEGSFGLMRNAYFEAAEILRKEKKFVQALLFYFYVCYIDLNGAYNDMGVYNDPDFDLKAFQKEISMIIPGFIMTINKLADLGDLTMDELEELYFYSMNKYNSFPYPIYSYTESWEHIKKALEEARPN